MSSRDNPQFQPQPSASAEPEATAAPDPLTSGPWAGDSGAPTSPTPPYPSLAPKFAENPVWSGWDVLLLAFLTLLTLLVVESITLLGAWRLVYPHTNLSDVAQKPAVGLLGQALSYIAVAMCMVMLVEGKYHVRFWKAIGWNWPSPQSKLLRFGVLGVLTVLLDIVSSRVLPMPKSTPFDQFFANPRDAYLVAAFAITVGPLWEELFFRGFLYPALARRTGVASAVLLTSLPFGLIHYPQYKSWAAVLVIVMVGVVLTVVRAVTKSVAASFVVHVGYNTTLMVLTAAATGGFRHMERATIALGSLPKC